MAAAADAGSKKTWMISCGNEWEMQEKDLNYQRCKCHWHLTNDVCAWHVYRDTRTKSREGELCTWSYNQTNHLVEWKKILLSCHSLPFWNFIVLRVWRCGTVWRGRLPIWEICTGQSGIEVSHLEIHGTFSEEITTLFLPRIQIKVKLSWPF